MKFKLHGARRNFARVVAILRFGEFKENESFSPAYEIVVMTKSFLD